MTIKAALATLDPFDDEHWTADGAPTLAAVAAAFGDKVTRKEVTEADPLFTRELAGQLDDVAPEPAEDDTPEPMSDLDKLREEQFDLEAQNAEIRGGIALAEKAIKANEVRLEKINDDMIVLDPPLTNMEGIQAYIAASNAARAARHGMAQRVAASLPASLVKVRAPIDEAFANRGNKRGGARPTR